MQARTPPVVERIDPAGAPCALVVDSPHSGNCYPADFGSCLPVERLRQGEDTAVDALWQAAPEVGATLIRAHFPRVYIDVNRELADLDPAMLDASWPQPLTPGVKTRLGKGLIWSSMDAATPIYARKLTVAEVRRRIETCYVPYHALLNAAVDERHRQFGAVWHLNLHSMPGDAYARLGITEHPPLADFVLGDRDGSTCEPAFIDVVAALLARGGYTVARNEPYKGVQLIARIGRPAERRHSLQIEIRRPIYMDEATRAPNDGFLPLQRHLQGVLSELADWVAARTRR